MEKLKQIVFNRFYFCILFMLSSLSATIPALLRFQSFNKIFLVWGFVILLHDVLTARNCLLNRYKWMLWAMLIVYGIAAILNFRYMTISNLSAVAYLALHFLLMDQYDPQMKKEQVYKEIRILTNIFLIFTFFMAAIALGMFVIQYEHSYKAMYAGELADFTMGIYQGQRLQGVYANPNELGAASLLAVMFSMLNVCLCKRAGQKFGWIYIVNGILSFLTLLLSLSRASQLTLLAFVFFTSCFFGRAYLIQKRGMVKRLASVATAVAIGFGSTVAVFIFMQGTKSVCAKVPALYEQLTNTEGDEPGSEHPSVLSS